MNSMQMYDNVLTESTDLVSLSKDKAANSICGWLSLCFFFNLFFFPPHQIDISATTFLPAISSFWSSPYTNHFLFAAF